MGSSVLVFRTGSLGDTLVALPALWAVREHFRDARITLLCDHHPRKNYVLASDLLSGSGVVDGFMHYAIDPSPTGRLLMPLRMAALAARIRRGGFDTLVYLAPTGRLPSQVRRDRLFFRAAGIRRFIGMDADLGMPPPPAPGREQPREADLILSHIAPGVPVPPPGQGRMELGLGEAEERTVRAWLDGLPSDGGRPWLGIGPGSKMPAKVWPAERYLEVVRALVEEFDVWPVVFGGAEDRAVGEWLVRELGRGYVAAGELGLRPSARALSRCRLYLGTDTGTMHMAVAVGVRCVAVFCSHAYPGMWFPYGPGHHVLRTPIACEGCQLMECVERGMECILSIQAEAVRAACAEVLGQPQAARRLRIVAG